MDRGRREGQIDRQTNIWLDVQISNNILTTELLFRNKQDPQNNYVFLEERIL